MDFSHVYDLHHLLSGRRTPLHTNDILNQLDIGRATFQRIKRFMIDSLDAPICTEKGRGYYYNTQHNEQYELPGLWFSAQELIALSLLEQLLETLQPVIVKELLEPVRDKMRKLIEAQGIKSENLQKRLSLLPQWQRPCDATQFARISQALLQRKQLEIEHHNRQSNHQQTRIISPQKLIYYRDNWYLDSWCHLKKGLRTFALDAIQKVNILDKPAKEISAKKRDDHFSTSYGIFAGEPTATATVDFSAKIGQWVSKEQWHPQQKSEWLPNGHYRLTIPYNNPTELILDIMRYGAEVEVISPVSLREQVKAQLKQALEQYS